MAVRGAQGGEHAQGTQPPLRHDREACDGHESDEEQTEAAQHQDQDLAEYLVAPGSGFDTDPGPAGEAKGLQIVLTGVKQDVNVGGPDAGSGRNQGELVKKIERVLDDADDLEAAAALVPGASDLELEASWLRRWSGQLRPVPVG